MVGGGLFCTPPIAPLHDEGKGDIRSLECFIHALSMRVFGPLIVRFI